MDFCLELEGSSRGVKKYYSREGWEIGTVRDITDVEITGDSATAGVLASAAGSEPSPCSIVFARRCNVSAVVPYTRAAFARFSSLG